MTVWRYVVGLEGRYLVSDTGKIYSLVTNKHRKLCNVGNGYLQVNFGRRHFKYVHRMVAEAFLGPSRLEVNHKDCNKHNNNLNNLEYVTSSGNKQHMIENGKHNKAILNTQAVREIRLLLQESVEPNELAERYKVSVSTISNIKVRKTWKWV